VNGNQLRRRRIGGRRDVAGCLQTRKALQAYLDGEIDELAARRIRRHLDLCRRCGLEASTYTEIKNAVGRRATSVSPGALHRLHQFGEQLAAGEHPDGGSR
jgi:anti-sigma factor RsiW